MDLESPFSILAKHQSVPVNVDGIARDLGLPVIRRDLGSMIAGQLMRKPGAGRSGFVIYINSSEHVNRQRFTLAHEIAHFILHRDLIETGVTDDTMYRSELTDFYE